MGWEGRGRGKMVEGGGSGDGWLYLFVRMGDVGEVSSYGSLLGG